MTLWFIAKSIVKAIETYIVFRDKSISCALFHVLAHRFLLENIIIQLQLFSHLGLISLRVLIELRPSFCIKCPVPICLYTMERWCFLNAILWKKERLKSIRHRESRWVGTEFIWNYVIAGLVCHGSLLVFIHKGKSSFFSLSGSLW